MRQMICLGNRKHYDSCCLYYENININPVEKGEQKLAIETSAHNVKDMIPLEGDFFLFVPKNILQNRYEIV
jgi:hypothetical protein